MNEEERLEQFEELISELREVSKDSIILLEGRKDRKAMAYFGIEGSTFAVQQEGGPVKAAEAVSKSGLPAIILTDWDTRGNQIAEQLSEQLSALCLEFDLSYRAKLRALSKKDVKDIESLPSMHERLSANYGPGGRGLSYRLAYTDVMSGCFIVFEGIDGTGKSTACKAVSDYFQLKGRKTHPTAEPTKDEIGMFIREGRVKNITQEAESLLFTADRAVHTSRIIEMRESGTMVLCDRYYPSTIAYQSAKLKGSCMDRDWLWKINEPIISEPDITFILDMDPEKTLERVDLRGEKSKFEELDYLKEVRSNYLRLAEEKGYKIIDASRSPEDVATEIIAIIENMGI